MTTTANYSYDNMLESARDWATAVNEPLRIEEFDDWFENQYVAALDRAPTDAERETARRVWDDLTAAINQAHRDDLVRVIIEAGENYAKLTKGKPEAFYLQRSGGQWLAEFEDDDTTDTEHHMTRWATGDEAAALYHASTNASIHLSTLQQEADDILFGWDKEWTD